MEMRGPGQFFGTKQSGVPGLKVARLSDVKIIEASRKEAEHLLDVDPGLIAPEHLRAEQPRASAAGVGGRRRALMPRPDFYGGGMRYGPAASCPATVWKMLASCDVFGRQ